MLQMGQFYYAAKAFDVLERLDPNPEYWEGKQGACVGSPNIVFVDLGRRCRFCVRHQQRRVHLDARGKKRRDLLCYKLLELIS